MLLDDFIRYVKIDTQSDDESELTPSTLKQYDLLNLLKKELDELKVETKLDEYGRLYAYLEGKEGFDPIGLCAHVDTALECSDKDVKPQIIRDYDGKDIKLGTSGLILSPIDYPKLKECLGKTIVTTDGTTLLGADDKAGIAIIMDVVKRLIKLPKDERRSIGILFTPDEEIGRGPEHFSLKDYRVKYAYTIDGADPKFISIENFYAYSCSIDVFGKSIHPGEGKGKLLNASLILSEFINLLPKEMSPYYTSNREGFNHVVSLSGSVEHANAHIIIRNHDKKILEKQIQDFKDIKKELMERYPELNIELLFKEQYKNMIEVIKDNKDCVSTIENAMRKNNIAFEYEATRGGTDGATFSFLGCPCPNIGTGSYNHHGKFEFAVLEEMLLMSDIAFDIFKI